MQHLQPGSNLSPLAHFLMMGAVDEQMMNELQWGSDGFGNTDPIFLTLQGFPGKRMNGKYNIREYDDVRIMTK